MRLESHLRALTEHHETLFAEPWSIDDAPDSYIHGLLKGIVGIEIPIARFEGKWKVSQNRVTADRQGAIDGLRSRGDAVSLAMADWIASKNS